MNSSQVDEKVVSLAFNNANFEKNVRTSLSTLDKLKSSLKFKGATDSIKGVSSAVKSVSFTPITRGIQEVHNSFRAMEVVGITALSNITNSAVNAGKNIVKALTVTPVMSGFQEYETQINAIQTILANTQGSGVSLEDINVALDELNHYADKTIYNFTEMTKNIGRFTAAGVDLQTSVDSIKGIANLAAMSGSTSLQASTAMYQLSQAIAAGKVQLLDWNSVVNAQMGGKTFQDALIRTSEMLGTGAKEAIESYGSFRESLTETGWLTTEVLTETLKQLSGAYTEADLIAQGFTQEQAADIVQLAATAEGAATDVKTFTQLIDTTMEALQSGWTQTWELIIGDFNEAKNMFSEISRFFNDMIENMTNARNGILEGAINPFGKLEKKLADVGIDMKTFQEVSKQALAQQGVNLDELIEKYGSFEATFQSGWLTGDMFNNILSMITGDAEGAEAAMTGMAHTLEEYQDIVNAVIRGDYGNIDTGRFEKLAEAGWDAAVVQELVNQQLWTGAFNLENLNDEQLTALGLTEEQIKSVRELGQEALKADSETGQLLDDLAKKPGHELIFESVMNSLQFLQNLLDIFSSSFSNVFGTMDSGDIYTILENINKFTSYLVGSEDALKDFGNFLEGIFSVIKLGFEGIKGLFDWFVDLVNSFKEAMGLDVSGSFSGIGQALKGFADWVRNSNLVDFLNEFGNTIKELILPLAGPVGKVFGEFVKLFKVVGSSLMNLIDNLILLKDDFTFDNLYYVLIQFVESIYSAFKDFGTVLFGELTGLFDSLVQFINDAGSHVLEFFTSLDNMLSQNSIIGPFYKNLKAFIKRTIKLFKGHGIYNAITKFWSSITEAFLGISKVVDDFFIALNNMKDNVTFDGLIQAFVDLFTGIYDVLADSSIIDSIIEVFSSIWESVSGALRKMFVDTVYEIKNFLENLSIDDSNLFSGFASFLLSAIGVLEGIPDKISPVIGSVIDFVTSFSGQFDQAGASLEDFFNTASDIFGKVAKALLDILLNPTKAYADEIEGTVNRIEEAGSNLLNPFNQTEGGLESFFEKVKEIFIKFKDFVEETIGFDGLFASALGLGVLLIIQTMIDKISKAVKPITDAINNITGGFKAAADGWSAMQKSMGKAAEYRGIALIILSVAAVLGVLALAFYSFAQLDKNQLSVAITAVGVITGAIIILAVAISVMSYALRNVNPAVMFSLGIGIIGISGSLLMLAGALKLLDGVDSDHISKNVNALLTLMVALVVASVLIGRFGPKVDIGVGSMIALSAALFLMTLALKTLGDINFNADSQTIQNLIFVFGGIALLVAATHGLKLSSVLGLILIVFGIQQILHAVDQLAKFDSGQFAKATQSFIGLFIGISILMLATKLAGKHALGGGVAILLVTASLWLMLPLIQLLGSMDPKTSEQGINALLWMLGGIATLFAVSALTGKHAIKAGLAIILASFALGVMAALVVLLGHIKSDNMMQGLQALGLMVLALDSMFVTMGLMGKGLNGNDPKDTLTRALLIIVALMVGLGVLSFMDPATLMNTAISISIVLGSLALAFASMALIPTTKGIVGKVTAMALMIAVIGSVLGIMAKMDANSAIESGVSIAIVVASLALAFTTMGAIPDTKGIIPKILAMSLVVAAIGIVLGMMAYMDVEGSIQTAVALGVVMLAMSASMLIIGQINNVSSTALLGLVVMIIALEMAANALSVLQGMAPDQAIGIAIALGLVLLEMTVVLALASLIGPVAGLAIKGFLTLILALGILTTVMAAVGKLSEFLGQGNIEAAVNVLGTVGEGIGSFLGNIVGGLAGGIGEGMVSALPGIAEDLSSFTEKISGMTELTPEDFAGLSVALDCVKKAQEIGMLAFNKEGMEEAMGYMTSFIQNAGALSSGMSAMSEGGSFDTTNFDAMISMCESMNALQAALEGHGGFIQGIFGEKDLAEFGSDCRSFVAQMNIAITAINGLEVPDMTRFNSMMTISNSLSEFHNTIDGKGGFIEDIFGDNSLGTFGEDMSSFVTQVQIFIVALNDMTDPDEAKLDSMMKVSETLQGFQETLNGIGGVADFFLGDQSLAGFGKDMAAFVEEVDDFIVTNNQLTDPDMDKLDKIIAASQKLQGFQESLEGIGGIVQFFMNGDNSLATFGSDMSEFIRQFNIFYGNAKDANVDPETLDPVIDACKKMQEFKNSLPEKGFFESLGSMFGLDAISAFGEEMKHMGMAFASFEIGLGDAKVETIVTVADSITQLVSALSLVNSYESATDSVNKLQEMLDGLSGMTVDATVMSTLHQTIEDLGGALDSLKTITDFSFSDENIDFDIDDALDTALGASVETVEGYKETFAGLGDDLGTALTGALDSSVAVMEGYQEEFAILGESLLSDFVEGVEDVLNGDNGVNIKVQKVIDTMEQVLSDETSGFSSSGKSALDNFMKGIENSMPTLYQQVVGMKNLVAECLGAKGDIIKGKGDNVDLDFASGITRSSHIVIRAVTSLYNTLTSAINILNERFFTAGANAAQGLVDGLQSKVATVHNNAVALAEVASSALQGGLDEHSPSRLWHKFGDYATQGFINGLVEQTSNVASVSKGLANTASDGIMSFESKLSAMNFSELGKNIESSFSGALTPLNNIDLSSLDANPVIRPVLDLTDVESKASTIGSMLNAPTLKVNGIENLGSSISKNQNGSEILAALNDLKKSIGTPVTNSYTINGITYDDGSNITEAISTLVHAAIVEGRM